jgi:hypothetical protein
VDVDVGDVGGSVVVFVNDIVLGALEDIVDFSS